MATLEDSVFNKATSIGVRVHLTLQDSMYESNHVTLTGTDGGNYGVSTANGDKGSCLPGKGIDKYCEKGLAIGINYVSALKCTSTVCRSGFSKRKVQWEG